MLNYLILRYEKANKDFDSKSISKDRFFGILLELREMFKFIDVSNNVDKIKIDVYVKTINTLLKNLLF